MEGHNLTMPDLGKPQSAARSWFEPLVSDPQNIMFHLPLAARHADMLCIACGLDHDRFTILQPRPIIQRIPVTRPPKRRRKRVVDQEQ